MVVDIALEIIAVGFLSLAVAAFFAGYISKQGQGNEKMARIAKAIQEGSKAFLKRQYRTVALFTVAISVLLYAAFGLVTSLSFALGAILSALAGYIGMMVSVKANVRCANAANKGLQHALNVAFRGGAVNGLVIVGLGLIGVVALYLVYGSSIVGFTFGASLVSLFARVGGGIYTKAADVGADLVGKVEKGIPEDDPRNPAVIADNVGDNVGDCAGMGADLFESYVVTLIAAMILGSSVTNGIIFSLLVAAIGTVASIVGIFFVRTSDETKIWSSLNKGLIIATIISAAGFYLAARFLFDSMNLFWATIAGLATTIIIAAVTDYYTSKQKGPVQGIARASETGAATNIISGLALGMRSTILPVIVISAAIIISFYFAGVFGIAMAAMGLLSLTGIIMSIDTYGPISDNAGGIAEMAKMNKKVRKVTDALDAVGNTTKATTKGVAIASAALSALALLAAFGEAVGLKNIDIIKPNVLVGLLIGGSIPFVFSSYLMKAVGNAAQLIVKEVRRQFKEISGVRRAKPDYARCVDISTKAALEELVTPVVIAVGSVVFSGLFLGAEALGALLAGSVITGLLLALMLANAGAAWDNAKKFIEDGNLGGKGSETHKAAVVGDTVGDPSKDTAGPAINSLIKVMSTLSIVLAPLLL
jgi:K(+)-stimulated pyrophosphate-energized sodium pump